ncbi:MAG: hypothetical protein GYB64_08510 [Chloroflexi bacterium]|nr:hypothetical protein [Chloroflexota bacterium]
MICVPATPDQIPALHAVLEGDRLVGTFALRDHRFSAEYGVIFFHKSLG